MLYSTIAYLDFDLVVLPPEDLDAAILQLLVLPSYSLSHTEHSIQVDSTI